MKYVPPKYLNFIIIFIILSTSLIVTKQSNKKEVNLGSYSISENVSSKIYLNLKNIDELVLEIENIFINQQNNICTTGDIYIYGYVQNSDNFVRLRLHDISVSNNLKIKSKNLTLSNQLDFEQEPLKVYSNNFDCIGSKIYLYFERDVTVTYLLIDQIKSSKETNLIKSYLISAYS